MKQWQALRAPRAVREAGGTPVREDMADDVASPGPRPRLSRRIVKACKRALMALALATLPRLYLAYMRLVERTSTIEDYGFRPDRVREQCGQAVFALWHDEVFFVAWAFRRFRPHTLASRGDFGAVITRMLELCDFEVFRGGSSSGRSRRSPEVVADMIDHMRRTPGVLYGITVDGSAGPPYRLKSGALRIARACDAPVFVEKTWCKRYFRLPTWDRTIIPLPFNRIVHVYGGPYAPPRDAYEPKAFAAFHRTVEDALLDVTWYARTMIEGEAAPGLLEHYPEGWRPKESPPVLVRPLTPIAVDRPADAGD